MYTENKEGSSFKPVFYMLIITILVIIIYFFFTKSNFIFKQGSDSTSTIVTTDNKTINGGTTGSNQYVTKDNKILITTDTGELKELTVGDTIVIETYLGDTISAEEIEIGAIKFSQWASNNCLAGQIPKFNGLNWTCAYDDTLSLYNGGTNPTANPTNTVNPTGGVLPTNPPTNSRLTLSVTGNETKTVFLNFDGVPISQASFFDLNNYITGATFNNITGELSFARNELGPISVDLDGRYLTADSTDTLTNKSGNISMWTNDMGYLSVDNAMSFINKTIDITLNEIIGTANTVPIFGSDGVMISSSITPTQLGFLSNVTSDIQTQLNSKVPSIRQILTNGPLSGGGALTSDLSISIDQASALTDGYLSSSDFIDFSNVNWDEILNAASVYMDYRPNDTACLDDEILIYSVGQGWICGSISSGGLLANLTGGSGITSFTYDGSVAQTVSLGPLTTNWQQTGNFDAIFGATPVFSNPSAASDVYVQGNIESDGTIYANNLNVSGTQTNTGNVDMSSSTSFRMRQVADESVAACSFLGELLLDTIENKIYTCTVVGAPGTWLDVAQAAVSSPVNTLQLTSGTYDGQFTYTGGFVGYQAADQICNAEFAGSHMCQTDEVISYIHNYSITPLNGLNAWISEGAPGYTANSNDCAGWTNNSNSLYLGSFWYFDSNGGGNGSLINCSLQKSIACCE